MTQNSRRRKWVRRARRVRAIADEDVDKSMVAATTVEEVEAVAMTAAVEKNSATGASNVGGRGDGDLLAEAADCCSNGPLTPLLVSKLSFSSSSSHGRQSQFSSSPSTNSGGDDQGGDDQQSADLGDGLWDVLADGFSDILGDGSGDANDG